MHYEDVTRYTENYMNSQGFDFLTGASVAANTTYVVRIQHFVKRNKEIHYLTSSMKYVSTNCCNGIEGHHFNIQGFVSSNEDSVDVNME
jgi:hypothetical protein